MDYIDKINRSQILEREKILSCSKIIFLNLKDFKLDLDIKR